MVSEKNQTVSLVKLLSDCWGRCHYLKEVISDIMCAITLEFVIIPKTLQISLTWRIYTSVCSFLKVDDWVTTGVCSIDDSWYSIKEKEKEICRLQ